MRIAKLGICLVLCNFLIACGADSAVVDTESIKTIENSALEEQTETLEMVETEQGTEVDTEIEELVEESIYTYTDLDKIMYAKSSVNIRDGADSTFEKLGSLSQNEQVKVTGQCNETNWYRIIYNGAEAYVSNNYLVDEKIEVVENNATSDDTTNVPSTTPSSAVLGPEPAYGSVVTTEPQDGYIWCPVKVRDRYVADYGGWIRSYSQDTTYSSEKDPMIFEFYSYNIYPYNYSPGYDMQDVYYPTFWIYLGDGAF